MLRVFTSSAPKLARSFSSIPVNSVASVLKLNVGNEETAIKFDTAMQGLHKKMQGHDGYDHCIRHVCKAEWAYELSFVFSTPASFGEWKTCALRDDVHADYLAALNDCGIPEDKVYGGARVHDVWK
jgi:hypothetical protein